MHRTMVIAALTACIAHAGAQTEPKAAGIVISAARERSSNAAARAFRSPWGS